MKKIYCLLMSSFLMLGCMEDDLYKQATDNQEHLDNVLKGKSFILNQDELQKKYPNNSSLQAILTNEFKGGKDLITTFDNNTPQAEVHIDLDYIQVFESETNHTITYFVSIGEPEQDNTPSTIYNLVYYSTDHQNYYASLLRYNFTSISIGDYIQNPSLDVVSVIPLGETENIYDNIQNSISSAESGDYPSLYVEFINLADCMQEVNVPSQPCKKCGRQYGEAGCENTERNTRAQPPRSYLDFSNCGGRGTGSGTGGNPTAPGPVVGGPTGGNPRHSFPVKFPGDYITIGEVLLDPNFGSNDTNRKTLNNLVKNNKAVLQALLNQSTDTREHGYAFSKQKINNEYTPKANLTEIDVNAASNWSLNINPIITISSYTGVIHSHTNPNAQVLLNGSYIKAPPMFSHSDILALFLLSKENTSIKKQLAESFFGLMTPTSLYVIMFPNDATLDNFGTKYGKAFLTIKKDKKMWGEINQNLEKEYGKIASSTDTDQVKAKKYEKTLLTVLKKNNLPINLYKLDANNGQFDGTWKLLSLDSTGNITENNGL